jgi:hypothetical protein
MPLSPTNQTKLDKCTDLMERVSERMDALTSRRAKRDADKVQTKTDRARRDADQLDPAAEAMAATPDLALLTVDPNAVPQHPWYDSELLASERRELRTGALSKGDEK